MPISPLRMSVMRGATNGTVKGFQPLEKEVYTLGSKEKAKLGGKVIKGTQKKKSSDIKPVEGLTGGPAWQKTDQSKESEKKWASTGNSVTPTKPKAKLAKTNVVGGKPSGGGFIASAAGSKSYGQTGRKAPNIGPVSNKLGYAKRDAKLSAAKTAKSSYFESSRKKK